MIKTRTSKALSSNALAWDDVRYLIGIVRAGSLSRAAHDLGVDHSTLSRRLVRIENVHGVKLFRRSAKGLEPTVAGRKLVELAHLAEQRMLNVERYIRGLDEGEGPVRLATTSILATGFLAPKLPAFAAHHPRITLEVVVSREFASLVSGNIDVALRVRKEGLPPAEPTVIASMLGEIGWAAYAAADGAVDRAIRYHGLLSPGAEWLERHVGTRFAASVDEVPAACALARAGCGAAVLPCFYADHVPELRRISDVLEVHRLVLAVPAELRRIGRMRTVLDWVRDTARRERRRLAGTVR